MQRFDGPQSKTKVPKDSITYKFSSDFYTKTSIFVLISIQIKSYFLLIFSLKPTIDLMILFNTNHKLTVIAS